MYEYKFEKIELKGFSNKPQEDHHDMIHEYAKDGWRLVQIFAPGTSAYGLASYFELIFERQTQ